MSGTVLIDADMIVHLLASASSRAYDWGNGKTVTVTNERTAQRRADDMVADIQRNTECGRAILCLSEPVQEANWRRGVLPTYKANRGDSKPKGFWRLRDYLERKFITRQTHSLEADDLLGILMTAKKALTGRRVCASQDKDLLTVPGLHYQWTPTATTGHKAGVHKVGRAEALRRFMLQILTGDPVDGYTGIPGIGPKKAEKILGDCTTARQYWRAIVEAYDAAGLTEEDALVQARVARILQAGEYNPQTGVKLWTPPK